MWCSLDSSSAFSRLKLTFIHPYLPLFTLIYLPSMLFSPWQVFFSIIKDLTDQHSEFSCVCLCMCVSFINDVHTGSLAVNHSIQACLAVNQIMPFIQTCLSIVEVKMKVQARRLPRCVCTICRCFVHPFCWYLYSWSHDQSHYQPREAVKEPF